MFRHNPKKNKIYYSLQQKYDKLKVPYFNIITRYKIERELQLSKSMNYQILLFYKKYCYIFYLASVILVFFLSNNSIIRTVTSILLFIISAIIFWKIKYGIIEIENKILNSIGKKWTDLCNSYNYANEKIKEINNALEKEYYNICSNLNERPPDWEIRRRKVLDRDNYTCTECGWPRGYKRKARELHVHHIVPIYKGGDNSLDNLTTLCHVCHRKVDKVHSGVRNSKRKPKKQ